MQFEIKTLNGCRTRKAQKTKDYLDRRQDQQDKNERESKGQT